MDNHLAIPILVPMLTAMVLALVRGERATVHKGLSLAAMLGVTAYVFWLLCHVNSHGIATLFFGGWQPPFGIIFVADRLATVMLCITMIIGVVALAYTFWTVTPIQRRYFFYPMFLMLIAGVNWAFLTGDLFNLFVSYEVMLVASFGMMMAGGTKAQVRQTLKYIALNAIGSVLFVAGVGLIYATIGTLNFADMARVTAQLEGDRAALVTTVSIVLMIVFAMKTAAFPLFFWLPDSYPIVPRGIDGFFGGMLTKVGVYSLMRVMVMVFQQPGQEVAIHLLLVLSGFTMLLGVLGAMCQWDIRRILSWHIISQVGYMVMGIGLTGHADPIIVKLAIGGTIFYVVHNILVKSCLFLVGGIAERITGTQELKKMGGLLTIAPGVAGLFLVAGLSIAGIPPFSGFAGKFALVRVGFAGEYYIIITVAIVTSFFTLYSMTKIWSYVFWGEVREDAPPAKSYRGMMVPTAVLVVLTAAMGLFAQPFLRFADAAAEEIRDPSAYIGAVLGEEAVAQFRATPAYVALPDDGPAPAAQSAQAAPVAQTAVQDAALVDTDAPSVARSHHFGELPR